MKPLDPRLMTYASAARTWIILSASLGLIEAVAIIVQTFFIAATISPVITHGKTIIDVYDTLIGLIVIVCVRALISWLRTSQAHKAAQAAIIQLRHKVLDHAKHLGPRWLAHRGADTATLVTRGLNDLEPYFVDYLPQLMLAVTVTPLALAVMVWEDWISALVAVITIPLIPIFMILIGKLTQDFSERRLATMQRLGRQLLDLIAGLTTLKALGRERGPENEIRKLGRSYTSTTMATLRVAFLSGAVLELIGTISVALVAVEVGMRMVYGHVDLQTGLIAIMLAPEVYRPIRDVGKQFHASTNGVAAANAVFAILEEDIPTPGHIPAPDLSRHALQFSHVSVAARGAWAPADLSATITPGTLCALVGPSGAGKTTALMVALKQLRADRGQLTCNGIDINDIEESSWWDQIAWLPQHPTILPGTIRSNVIGDLDINDDNLAHAASDTGFDEVIALAKNGWDTLIGQGGEGLSVGQRQRLALTRILLGSQPLIIMDEPTAHLDATLEGHVLSAIDRLRSQGRTVVVIAHREALMARADQRIHVSTRPFTAAEAEEFDEREIEGAHASGEVEVPRLLEALDNEGEE